MISIISSEARGDFFLSEAEGFQSADMIDPQELAKQMEQALAEVKKDREQAEKYIVEIREAR